MMVAVLLKHGEQICGFPAVQAGYAARVIDAWQWCSAGVLARELQISQHEARALLLALEVGGYLTRYTGQLAAGDDGAWLPEEEDGSEPLLLWHLTDLDGMQLAKAHVGSPMSRAAAEALLDGLLDRVRTVNRDPCATHVVESVVLYGSLVDPDRVEVTDVDTFVSPGEGSEAPTSPPLNQSTPSQDGLQKHKCVPSVQRYARY